MIMHHTTGIRFQRFLLCLALGSLLGLLTNPALSESLQDQVSRANAAAGRQDYAAAILLYEQIVAKAPKEATLKHNLAILHVNYGVSLQEKKQYNAALAEFDKALALYPNDAGAIEAKAATYFYQAIDMREQEGPEPKDYPTMRALMEKALALQPNQTGFKKTMGSLYLEEAYTLATQEKFSDAAPLLEKALTFDAQNTAIRHSLANVYLGLARNEPTNMQSWIEKALAADNSPKIQQVASQLQKRAAGGNQTAGGPQEAQASAPPELSQLSITELLQISENQLGLSPPPKATLLARLETLEDHVYGKPQKGALAARAKAVYTSLMGSYSSNNSDANIKIVQAPIENSENSYLEEIFKVTDGKVIRWGKFPVRVYIEEPPKDQVFSNLYKPEFKAAILEGFTRWKEASNGVINYVEVKRPDTADVLVSWSELYQDKYVDPDKAPSFYKDYAPPKRTHLMRAVQMAAMLTPGYFSLAPQAVNAAMQYQYYKKMDAVREESRIVLGLKPTETLTPEQAKTLISNMAAKEFGHALGLKGCSPKAGDLLYPELKADIAKIPSNRDLETLRQIYNRPPNIILNVR